MHFDGCGNRLAGRSLGFNRNWGVFHNQKKKRLRALFFAFVLFVPFVVHPVFVP